jgi:hypothetical protein
MSSNDTSKKEKPGESAPPEAKSLQEFLESLPKGTKIKSVVLPPKK